MITWFAQKSTHIQALQSFSRGTIYITAAVNGIAVITRANVGSSDPEKIMAAMYNVKTNHPSQAMRKPTLYPNHFIDGETQQMAVQAPVWPRLVRTVPAPLHRSFPASFAFAGCVLK